MRKSTSMWLAVVCATTLSALTPAVASEPNAISMEVAGEGDWSVWCDFADGGDNPRFLRPGRASYSSLKLRRAACRYQNARIAPMTIRIEGAAWKCPFRGADPAKCEKTFPEGAFGSYDLKSK